MILEPITKRRSHFSFSGEPVAQEKLLEIIEAATHAPSGGNNQPWRYYYALNGTSGFDALLGCLDEGNQRYADKAGALILSAAQMKYVYKDKEYKNSHAWHDTGLANSLLLIQAVAIGLKSHPMGGFDPEKARKVANLGPDYDPVVMIAVGYPGNEASLPADILKKQTAPRKRKPFEEIVKQL
ncbi:MAG: nitroreductase family protein [Bacteroidetes bacterium]|nr:nitroreductase family protein [Bacteroidota bacterium]